jgi:hypothetical protein
MGFYSKSALSIIEVFTNKLTFNEIIDDDSDSYIKALKVNHLEFRLGKKVKFAGVLVMRNN